MKTVEEIREYLRIEAQKYYEDVIGYHNHLSVMYPDDPLWGDTLQNLNEAYWKMNYINHLFQVIL